MKKKTEDSKDPEVAKETDKPKRKYTRKKTSKK
jgi:hypothetical protein